MKTRILTAIVGLAVLAPFCIFSASPSFVFLIFVGIISVFAVYEILKCTGLHKNVVASLLSYPTALAATVLTRIIASTERYFLIMSFVYFALIFLSFVNATFSKGKISVVDACVSTMMTVYVTFSMASLVLLRDIAPAGGEAGSLGGKIYLLVFLFAWVPDIGGYFFGRLFGKHKLIPDVSPKKTVEGFFGGIILSVLASVIYGFIIGLRAGDLGGFLLLGGMSVICAVVSVCGDLLASLVKRHYNIKDYGFVFPGHGGVMDRFDSIISVAPFLYILCYIANTLGWFADLIAL